MAISRSENICQSTERARHDILKLNACMCAYSRKKKRENSSRSHTHAHTCVYGMRRSCMCERLNVRSNAHLPKFPRTRSNTCSERARHAVHRRLRLPSYTHEAIRTTCCACARRKPAKRMQVAADRGESWTTWSSTRQQQ